MVQGLLPLPPSSLLGKAMRYILNHHVALGRFLESGDVPIDNGIVERLHVRAALTRKAYLFAGRTRAANARLLRTPFCAVGSPVWTLSSTFPTYCREWLVAYESSICRRCCRPDGNLRTCLRTMAARHSAHTVVNR